MNRIVLIGNGFDLAHGLKTQYKDFIDWYWRQRIARFFNECTNISQDPLCTFIIKHPGATWNGFFNQYLGPDKEQSIEKMWKIINDDKNLYEIKKSIFFDNINKSIETKGWVDIENEYYNFLIEIDHKKRYDYDAKKLNSELEFIRRKLSEYITLIQAENINRDFQIENIRNQIFSPIKLEDVAIESKDLFDIFIASRLKFDDYAWLHLFEAYHDKSNNLANQMFLSDIKELKNHINNITNENDLDFIYKTFAPKEFFFPDNIMILNFNYTTFADQYIPNKSQIITVNHIHGNLTDIDSIIFGYGDELDDKYKYLKELNDNEYLRFFKSTRYLESDNYRRMLSFIESAPFQVLIMGHSCGNSDRTLLNTLFEHNNCVSIKPYYYQKNDGSDNYLDLIQNISRNFTDMKKMRDRAVNKTYCEPLPQASQNNSQPN